MTDKPHILFRADGGRAIGLGHIKRCETLAREPGLQGCRISFLVTEDKFVEGYLCERGFETRTIPASADRKEMMRLTLDATLVIRPDLVFIDLINTELFMTRGIRDAGIRVVAIDDMGPGAAALDALTGVDIGVMPESLPEDVRAAVGDRIFAGPEYAIVDPKFHPWRDVKSAANFEARRALLMFGGSDPNNCTRKVTSLLMEHPGDFQADIVIGPYVADKQRLVDLISGDERFAAHMDPPDMPRLMAEASFAVCAVGQSLYESTMLGAPALLITQSPLQTRFGEKFVRYGSAAHVGSHDGFSRDEMIEWFDGLLSDRERWTRMHEAARRVIDGGGARRIAEIILDTIRKSSE